MTDPEVKELLDLAEDWDTIANQHRALAEGNQFTPEDRLRNKITYTAIEMCIGHLLNVIPLDPPKEQHEPHPRAG